MFLHILHNLSWSSACFASDANCIYKRLIVKFSDQDPTFNPKVQYEVHFNILQLMGCSVPSPPSLFPFSLCDLSELKLRAGKALWIKYLGAGQWGGGTGQNHFHCSLLLWLEGNSPCPRHVIATNWSQVAPNIFVPVVRTFLHTDRWLLTQPQGWMMTALGNSDGLGRFIAHSAICLIHFYPTKGVQSSIYSDSFLILFSQQPCKAS